MAVAMWAKVAGLVALTASVVLGRIDQTLAQFQRPDYPAGGIGDLATPAALFRPGTATEIARGWVIAPTPWELDSISLLTTWYFVMDVALMLALAFLLLAWLANVEALEGKALPIIIGGYVLGDALETGFACFAWRDYGSVAQLTGGFSLAKWVCLFAAIATLGVFSLRQYFASNATLRSRLLGALLDTVLRFRAQVLVVGFLAAVFLLLSSDLGRQVDDVLVRAAEQGWPAVLASTLAVSLAFAISWTCARCSLAYQHAPGTADPDWSQRRVGFWVSLVLLIVTLGASAVWEETRAFFISMAVLAGAGALVFVKSLRPAVELLGSTGEGIDTAAAAPGFLRPTLVAAPLVILYLAIARASATQIGGSFSPSLGWWLAGSLACLVLITAILGPADETEPDTGVDPAVWTGAIAGVVLAFLSFAPPTSWMQLGTPGVLVLWACLATYALAGLVVLGDNVKLRGVVAFGLFGRWPVLGFLLVWSLIASAADLRGAYYDVRLREDLQPSTAAPAQLATASASFKAWASQSAASGGTSLVFVASAGGGIRAAYWTAISWACVFEGDCGGPGPAEPTIPSEKVFLASGVSGGSLGLVSVLSHQLNRTDSRWMDRALVADFVAAALAGFLFRDLPNSALRLPWPNDRAGRLELAWESADSGLDTSFRESTADRFPRLILNSTSAEDGCRLALASVELAAGNCEPGSDATQSTRFVRDASTFLCDDAGRARGVNLSTAALLSARFPYVSPAGGMISCSKPGDSEKFRGRTFALDGGILDNSGAGAVEQAWREIETEVQQSNALKTGPCVIPRLLVLDNAYAESATARAKSRPIQGIAPLQAGLGFYGSRSDRELASAQDVIRRAAERAADLCEGAEKPVPPIGESVAIIHPTVSPGTQAPLGWTLSSSSVASMRSQLVSDGNLTEISRARCWFLSGANC